MTYRPSQSSLSMNDKDDTPPRQQVHPRRIVFDGTINAGHLLTFFTLIATLAVGWNAMDKRVAVLERDSVHQNQRDAAQDYAIREGIVEIKGMVKDVQRSVDAVRETQHNRQDGSRAPSR